MQTEQDIERQLRSVRFTTSQDLDRRIASIASEAGSDSAESNGKTSDASVGTATRSRRKQRRRSRGKWPVGITKIAAGILLLAGALALVVTLAASGGGIVLADVVHTTSRAESVTFVQQVKSDGKTVLDLKGYLQGHDLRWEMPSGVVCVENRKARQGLFIDTPKKQAARYDFPKETSDRSLWQTNPIRWLKKFKTQGAESLGRKILDGKQTEMFATTQAGVFTEGTASYGFRGKYVVKIWVDVETKLPLKIEIGDLAGDNVITFAQMSWNKPLAADLFDWNAPQDFTQIDKLISAQLDKAKRQQPRDLRADYRRIYLDLTGIPPTTAQINEFFAASARQRTRRLKRLFEAAAGRDHNYGGDKSFNRRMNDERRAVIQHKLEILELIASDARKERE